MKSPERLFKFHVANLRTVNTALTRVALSLRSAVARSAHKDTEAFTRLYALLLGAWAECRLAKLLYEPNAFDDTERSILQRKPTHLERWLAVVEIAFRKHYGITKAELSAHTLPHTAFTRYRTLIELLHGELQSTITLRNKLAHGQWIYPMNENGDDIAQAQMDALRTENILSLQLKRRILDYLLNIVHNLVVSKATFERDFDDYFRGIEQTRQHLKNRLYSSYEQKMRSKFVSGLAKKRGST